MQSLNFLNSLLTCNPGSYNIFGIKATFLNKPKNTHFHTEFINTISLSYLREFIHEFGHALASKAFYHFRKPKIEIYKDEYKGNLGKTTTVIEDDKMVLCIVKAGGPITSVAFATSTLAITSFFKNYLPLSVSIALTHSSVQTIKKELGHMFHEDESTDWRVIQRTNKVFSVAAATIQLTLMLAGIISFASLADRNVIPITILLTSAASAVNVYKSIEHPASVAMQLFLISLVSRRPDLSFS